MTVEEEIKSLEERMNRARLRAKAAIFLREAEEEQINHILTLYKLLTGDEPYEHVIFACCEEITECKLQLIRLAGPALREGQCD